MRRKRPRPPRQWYRPSRRETLRTLLGLCVQAWRELPLFSRLVLLLGPPLAIFSLYWGYQRYLHNNAIYQPFNSAGYNLGEQSAGLWGNQGNVGSGAGPNTGGGGSFGRYVTTPTMWFVWSFSTKTGADGQPAYLPENERMCYYAYGTLPARLPGEDVLQAGFYTERVVRLRWSKEKYISEEEIKDPRYRQYLTENFVPLSRNFLQYGEKSGWNEAVDGPRADAAWPRMLRLEASQSCLCRDSDAKFIASTDQPLDPAMRFCPEGQP